MAKKNKQSVFLPYSHSWGFRINADIGKEKIINFSSKVRPAKKAVTLTLTLEDVDRAHQAGGQGNSQTCAGAFCTKRLYSYFPHPVVGHTDWFRSRVFIASKEHKKNAYPTECVVYEHNSLIAHLFDTPKGLAELRRRIVANGGSVEVRLLPYKIRESVVAPRRTPVSARSGGGASGGAPSTAPTKARVSYGKGARARVANLLRGAVGGG